MCQPSNLVFQNFILQRCHTIFLLDESFPCYIHSQVKDKVVCSLQSQGKQSPFHRNIDILVHPQPA
uniref:Uncharacterized protein n=1 Tax=Arundo donax TaxID=35708 RepID=A0A0A8Z4N0_ARUDO